ncbi:oligopeptide/dipeptide ABC transporter ATP-binding protein [Cupriavidus basilensis]
MYLGRVVESAPAEDVFASPNHPLRRRRCWRRLPSWRLARRRLWRSRGDSVTPLHPPPGCHFHPRCPHAMPRCREEQPLLKEIAPGCAFRLAI